MSGLSERFKGWIQESPEDLFTWYLAFDAGCQLAGAQLGHWVGIPSCSLGFLRKVLRERGREHFVWLSLGNYPVSVPHSISHWSRQLENCPRLMRQNLDPISWRRFVIITLYVAIYSGMAVFGGKTLCHSTIWLWVKGKAKRALVLILFGSLTLSTFLNLSGA